MGSDLAIANSARVSYAKRSAWEPELCQCGERIDEHCWEKTCLYPSRMTKDNKVLSEKDAKLLKYLAENKHWTPFASAQVSLHLCLPIFLARQLMRSNVGIVWNEESRRYITSDPRFFEPAQWRAAPSKGNSKQGSSEPLSLTTQARCRSVVELSSNYSHASYSKLLELGVAPEQARMVLPVCTYTQLYGTMSLVAAARIVTLRQHAHAQAEIRDYATAISTLLAPLFPVSWPLLTKE